MIVLTFVIDNKKLIELSTNRNDIIKIYSLLLSTKRCSAFHAYTFTGIEIDLETGNIRGLTP